MSDEFTLSGVVAEICERAGMPFGKFDVSKLNGFVGGMQITNKEPAFRYLQILQESFFFDPCGRDGILDFIHRGAEPVRIINELEIISDSDKGKTRKSNEKIPSVLNINYYDTDGGIDTDKQTSDRSHDTRGEGEENINSPLVMTADFAAKLAVVKHKILVEERKGEQTLKLPDNYLDLTVGDVVVYLDDRLRIDEIKLDDGEQELKLSFDRKSAYNSSVFGVPPVPPPPIVSVVPGVTHIEFIDCPILSAGDDEQLGFYVAISGERTSWRGAKIEMSIDGGATFIDSRTSSVSAVIGESTIALPAARVDVPDYANVLTVEILTPGVVLEGQTLASMMSRQNKAIIGDEIINFGTATEVSPGIWELSDLLRGRLGTSAAAHSIGERFVLLQRNYIEYVAADLYSLGQPLTFKATSVGSATETLITRTFNGVSQLERAPGYLNAVIDGANIDISWIGTGRLGGRGSVQMGRYFVGYRVYVNGSPTDTASQTLTVLDPGGAVTIQVCQVNSMTGEGPFAEITI